MAECLCTHYHFSECVHLEYRYGKVYGYGYEVKLLQSVHGGYHAYWSIQKLSLCTQKQTATTSPVINSSCLPPNAPRARFLHQHKWRWTAAYKSHHWTIVKSRHPGNKHQRFHLDPEYGHSELPLRASRLYTHTMQYLCHYLQQRDKSDSHATTWPCFFTLKRPTSNTGKITSSQQIKWKSCIQNISRVKLWIISAMYLKYPSLK